jgi:hypothetical protein
MRAATPLVPCGSTMMFSSWGRAKANTSAPWSRSTLSADSRLVAHVHRVAIDTSVEQVDRAQEAIHKGRGRVTVNLLGRAHLLHLAVIHQHHPVGHFEGFFLVVGHEDRGDVQFVMEAPQPAAQFLAHLGIEGAKRLVEEQHARLDGQRAGQRNTLALTAGELRRKAVGNPVELHELEQLGHLGLDRRFGRALAARLHAHAEGHVVEHGHVAKQRVMLEHETHLALAHMGIGGVGAVEQHLPAVGRLQTGDDAQQRRLAAAGRPQQGHQLDRSENRGKRLSAP